MGRGGLQTAAECGTRRKAFTQTVSLSVYLAVLGARAVAIMRTACGRNHANSMRSQSCEQHASNARTPRHARAAKSQGRDSPTFPLGVADAISSLRVLTIFRLCVVLPAW